MEVIIHTKNKNRLLSVIILIIFLSILFYFLIIFLRNPSKHIFFLLPTKNIVILFSLVGMMIVFLVFLNILYNIFFNKNPVLRIDETGIYNEFCYYDKKKINWSEIKKIEAIKYNHNYYIGIFLKKIVNNEKGIKRIIFNLNHKSMGTPYLINYRSLDCSFKQLKREIFEAYNRNK